MEDIDKLGTTAYPQYRNVDCFGLLQQPEVGFVPLQVVPCRHLWLLAITVWVYVGAARQHQAIEQRNIRVRPRANVVGMGAVQPQTQVNQSVCRAAPGWAADADGDAWRFGCFQSFRHNRAV